MPVVFVKCYLMRDVRAHTLGLTAVIIIGELAAASVALTNITMHITIVLLNFNV